MPAVGHGRRRLHTSAIHTSDILFNIVTYRPIARKRVGEKLSAETDSWKSTRYGEHVSVDPEMKDVSVEIDSWKQSIPE
jgi:hypothetical protein